MLVSTSLPETTATPEEDGVGCGGGVVLDDVVLELPQEADSKLIEAHSVAAAMRTNAFIG